MTGDSIYRCKVCKKQFKLSEISKPMNGPLDFVWMSETCPECGASERIDDGEYREIWERVGAVEFYDDDLKELADFLDGTEYPFRLAKETTDRARELGIVIVYGGSDDLMEFDGAWYEEIGAYGGTTATSSLGRTIEALWCANGRDGPDWSYRTDIPHETFKILEDGYVYCEGIVFYALSGEKWEEE